jgi:hypothetical protein
MWFERATVEMYRLWSLYWMGHFRELVERTASLRAQAIELGDLYSATSLSIGLPAVQWLVRGRPDEARQAADEALRGWSRRTYHLQHHWQMYALAHVDLYEGKAHDAWQRLKRGWADAGKALLRNLQMIRLEILWARGRAAILCAEQDEYYFEAMLRDAARCARALHRERRHDADALALCLEAGIRAVRGDVAGALPFLSAASDRAGEQELGFVAAATKAARGRILGGDRGVALTREAEAWMSDQAIADPQALCRMFLPGLPTASPEVITLNTGPGESVITQPRS